MSIEPVLLSNPIYIELPQGIIGWLSWLAFFTTLIFLQRFWHKHDRKWDRRSWLIFLVLLILVPLTGLFLALRLPAGNALPRPGLPADLPGPALTLFSALPWVLAAGLLGPTPAGLLGFLAGLVKALWETHNAFTPLELALLALVCSAAINQRFRTFSLRTVSHPLVINFLLGLGYPLLFLLDTLATTDGSLASRLDYGLSHVGIVSLAMGGELLIAGLFAELLAWVAASNWGGRGSLQPSPIERKLQTRFLYAMVPLATILVVALIVGDWIVAGNAARDMLKNRMSSTAQMAAETIPFYLETGQNLIGQLAGDERWSSTPENQFQAILQQEILSVPFFRQIYLLDVDKKPLTGYPEEDYSLSSYSLEELQGIDYALSSIPLQTYTLPALEGQDYPQVSFIAPIQDEQLNVRAVLVGRSDLSSNPYTKPIIASLESLVETGGEGFIIDRDGKILYHTSFTGPLAAYQGRTSDQAIFYEDTAADGTRRLVYFQPAVGHDWAVVVSIPARQAQQLALTIAVPLLVMVVVLFIVAIVLLLFGLNMVTASLQTLAQEANRISSGQLDHPLPKGGEDEVGQLSRAFEQMRISLKARLDELKRLLLVSQSVSSSLEMEESVQPILESALSTGACVARIILASPAVPELDSESPLPTRFGAGIANDLYSSLDEQIMTLNRQQERVVLNNLSRVRLLNFTPGVARPEALLALALRHENTFYGSLWLAFDTPHQFSDDEVRFLTTLAGQAAVAIANARLFMSAVIGRQRLAGILASTPDPVLVTDHQNRLLLANPAAWQALRLKGDPSEGKPVDQTIPLKELVRLLRSTGEEKPSIEVALPDGRMYLATASTVIAEGRRVGRICVLRDITHFKELDALKSEFVATVSHDLRSPLTLIRGYATMLEMVGDLNDQQTNYIRKILASVETMSRLVSNLLDLGRIEAGVDLQLEMVPVNDLIDRVTGSMQLQASQKHIQLTTELPAHTAPLVEADQSLLQQALSNLVENALKYTEAGGKVNVRTYTEQDMVVFEVSDTGIGISPVDQSRLFEKFYRGGQRETKKQHGTGLGLAIVKSISERHSGRVWVESQLGKGSTFYLGIPLRQNKPEKNKSKAIES